MNYDWLYLAPHLDDIVLSCGGMVYQQTQAGQRVLILTLTAGDPTVTPFSGFADHHHSTWKLDPYEVVAKRRLEDAKACERIGAEWLHWDLMDAIYRVHPHTGAHLYTSNAELFGPYNRAEDAFIAEVAARLATLPSAKQVVSPLTIGYHVDHQITRLAAEKCFGDSLLYYEDYPYVQTRPGDLTDLTNATWHAQTIPLTPSAITARYEGVLAYASQIDILFGGIAKFRAKLHQQITHTGGERLWCRS